jgi:large subunit ribosomal protein L25
VLYGHGNDAVSLSVDSKELYHLLHTGAGSNVLVDIVVDGTDHLAMPREIQRDAIRGSFWHIDFLEVSRDQTISVDVPIHVVGESVGVKQGGVLEHHLWDLRVECLPGDVPESIQVDISALEVGDSLKVSDLAVPSAVTVLTGSDESVLAVVVPQAREVEEAEAAAAAEAAELAEGEGGEAGAEGAAAEGSSEEGGES